MTVTINSTLENSGIIDNNGTMIVGTSAGSPTGGYLGTFTDSNNSGSLTINGGTGVSYVNNSTSGITQHSFINNANLLNNNQLIHL